MGETKWVFQDEGFVEARQHKKDFNSWWRCSICLLDWGLYPDVRLTPAPKAWQKDFHTWKTDWGPRSDTMSTGIPWRKNTWARSLPVSEAKGNLGKDTRWATLENLSTTVKITEIPSDQGRPETKSKAMCDQGTKLVLARVAKALYLLLQQTTLAQMYSLMCLTRVGYQKEHLSSSMVKFLPRWQENLSVWVQRITWKQTAEGTYKRLGGLEPGSGSPSRASCSLFDIQGTLCYDTGGRKATGAIRLRALQLRRKLLGQGIRFYVSGPGMVGSKFSKLNRPKKRNHFACQESNLLVLCI